MATTGLGLAASPPSVPPTVGLIPSLSGPYLDPDDGDLRWEGGVRFEPEQLCNVDSAVDPCNMTAFTVPTAPDSVDFTPFYIRAGVKCTAMAPDARDWQARATRALLAAESKMIAAELWKGTRARAAGWSNHYLSNDAWTDTLTTSGSPVSVAQALECLEHGLGYYSTGAPGVIHCTRELGAAFSALANTVRYADGRILTYMGTTIIPDAGYDGSGPQRQPAINGSQWAYATLTPTVRRGPIEIVNDEVSSIDRSINDKIYVAQRLAAVTYPGCVQVAVEVNLPLCLVGGTS